MGMEVIIRDEAEDAAALTAAIVANAIRAKPGLVLGLATGRTMEAVYRLLVSMYADGGVDFSRVITFNLDEYIGVPPSDSRSFRYYMHTQLFSHINIDMRRTHVPNGMADDIDAECVRYEKALHKLGGIDLLLLGIGRSGHIGFNEPLSAMSSRTRPKALVPQTIAQNATLSGGPERVPRRAITMGLGTILDSKRCVLLATGQEKAEIIAKAVEGPVTAMIPASALHLHPRCTVIVDEEAASRLENKEYYRWIFENEPEWQPFH